jgi:hypothetical protein
VNEVGTAELVPGSLVTVIKLHPDGSEVTRYDAVVADEPCPDGWFAVNATWVNRTVSPHGLVFESGDTLVEYFSPDEWFNVFRVQSPQGETRGWYANVTYPTRIDRAGDAVTITWHDLYLDVIKLADGTVILCDEDELDESGVATHDPELHARIVHMGRVLVGMAERCEFPFHRRQ